MNSIMENLIIVRGGGDIATGTIHKLHRCGFPVLVLETLKPSAIRRCVSFSEAVYDGLSEVEGVTCRLADSIEPALEIIGAGDVAMIVDERCCVLERVKPLALIDCIMAKKNLGANKDMAPITIALGPGFTAGKDADLVIETMRGHDLGRIIDKGKASEDTEEPGSIDGFTIERVIYSAHSGILHSISRIGDCVKKGQTIAVIRSDDAEYQVDAAISGILRGLIREGFRVEKGLKIADIDPRESERNNCFTISDKARCIAGSVLEGLLLLKLKVES